MKAPSVSLAPGQVVGNLLRSKFARGLLIVIALAGPATFGTRAACAADVPATTDISWIRLASYVGQRYGPLLLEIVSELLEHFGDSGAGAPPPPPPPPAGDPPIGDPEYTP